MTSEAITGLVHKTAGGNPDTGAVESVPTLTQVFEAIRQIHDAGGEPTRERIHQITGLKLSTVDDRIKVLRGEGMIAMAKQCYRPVHAHAPARDVIIAHLNNGMTMLEVGPYVLHLVPAEAHRIAQALAGKAMEYTALERFQELQGQLLEEAARRRELEREVKALKSHRRVDIRQGDLLLNMVP